LIGFIWLRTGNRRDLAKRVMIFRVTQNAENFLTGHIGVAFSKRNLFHKLVSYETKMLTCDLFDKVSIPSSGIFTEQSPP
jgi:hypothetical protein